jgi:phospholipase/carboxylesterase
MRTIELSGLRAHLVGGVDGSGGGQGPVIVLAHGFGASGDDLVLLASAISVPKSVRFVFPEAPLRLPPELGGYGRMWWNIDLEELERSMRTGTPRDMSTREPVGLREAGAQFASMLSALEATLFVPSSEVIIGGFSQGAMLACEVALTDKRPLAGLVMLSGTMLARERWVPAMGARAALPVFASHGTHDPTLPYSGSEALVSAFDAAGAEVRFVSFTGGHEIPPPVLQGLERFVHEVFPHAR